MHGTPNLEDFLPVPGLQPGLLLASTNVQQSNPHTLLGFCIQAQKYLTEDIFKAEYNSTD